MAKRLLAALLAACTIPVQAQPQSPGVPLQPSVDSPGTRQAFQTLSACLAHARPRWARQTLSQPYLSKAQASVAAQALVGKDRCIPEGEAELTFRTSGLVGNLAEHYVRADLQRADLKRLASALSTTPPLNVTEDFALCVAARNPTAARDLVTSEMGSPAETEAARRVATNVGPCTNPNEQLTVDIQSLRSLMSVALYRGLTAALAGSG